MYKASSRAVSLALASTLRATLLLIPNRKPVYSLLGPYSMDPGVDVLLVESCSENGRKSQ